MEPQIFPDQIYAPDTPLSWIVTVPVAYDMTGKKVTFELVKSDVVIFQLTDTAAEIDITGQIVTVTITPDVVSEEASGNTFAEAMEMARRDPDSQKRIMPFNCDIQATGSDSVDIRMQGNFEYYPEHGKHGS